LNIFNIDVNINVSHLLPKALEPKDKKQKEQVARNKQAQ
jgi:hypothetical protein